MVKTTALELKALIDAIDSSKDDETYKQLEKTRSYRIGVGARRDSCAEPLFFLDMLIILSDGTEEVDISRLEKIVHLLKVLQTRGYVVSYLDDTNSISCELVMPAEKIFEEYTRVKALVHSCFG
jgi:hypothetical protein